MVRKNGWQLPAHTFQIIAITVFFLLVVAFYAFFAPFLGKQVLEFVAFGIYTPVAFVVFILYIRCTSINPADSGIMSKFDDRFRNAPASGIGLQGTNLPERGDVATGTNSPTSTFRGSLDGRSNHAGLASGDRNNSSSQPPRSSSCSLLGGLICALFVEEDCRKLVDSEHQVDGEDSLFCTLCNAEVLKFSKHCRSCDKCVDGFDHHCRWLNNCVGRNNYFTFIALMITSLLWLVIEIGVGIAVLVVCFVNKNSESIIQDKLGNGLTRPPFAAIVAIFTLLSIIACIPLGELFFFHMILIRKGITTYEYVVAMRAMSEAPQEEEEEEDGLNIVYSPTNSATTGFSGGSLLGLPYKGSWCTPPRIFIDQDEVIPHLDPGMAPSTIDPDTAGHAERANKAKKQVKISAWKLAKLDTNEAMKAAARARASSSVLRPVDARHRGHDADLSSSGNGSVRSSMSADHGGAAKEQRRDARVSSLPSSCAQSMASQDEYEQSGSSVMSSPVRLHKLAPPHAKISVPPRPPPLPAQNAPPRPPPPVAAIPRPPPVPTTTRISNPMFQSATSYVRENRRASVVWDQEAGRYVSVAPAPATARPGGGGGADQPARAPPCLANPGGEREAVNAWSRNNPTPTNAAPSSSSLTLPSGPPSERLTYSGQSIFFGGPRLGAATAGGTEPRRNEAGTRARAAESFPVFAPGTFQKNPPFRR